MPIVENQPVGQCEICDKLWLYETFSEKCEVCMGVFCKTHLKKRKIL